MPLNNSLHFGVNIIRGLRDYLMIMNPAWNNIS